jgi:hypothetical protein
VKELPEEFNLVEFEVVTPMDKKTQIFWDIKAVYAGLLLALFFDSEDGDDMFIRNVG